jgi:hypothetical protein
MDGLASLTLLWGGALIGLAVGCVYFLKASSTSPVAVRLLTSAFGPSLFALFVFAGLLWPEAYRFNTKGTTAYLWLQVVPLVLLVVALLRYPGPKRLHWALVPAGLVAWAWTFALGWLFVHGE